MKGKITVLFGLVLILTGLIWYATILRESTCASNAAETLIPQVQQVISEQKNSEPESMETNELQYTMTETMIGGVSYVGLLKIPVLRLELPVISFWSAENGKIAPCRYSGSVHQNDLILCAHNYDSHFGRLNQLAAGDAIEFIDMDGNCYSYQVQEALTVDGTEVERIRDGDWDLTLFTCTSGGNKRYVIRCRHQS